VNKNLLPPGTQRIFCKGRPDFNQDPPGSFSARSVSQMLFIECSYIIMERSKKKTSNYILKFHFYNRGSITKRVEIIVENIIMKVMHYLDINLCIA